MKKSFSTSFIIMFLMLASCKEAKPQTRAEMYQQQEILERENTKQFFLAASKLCLNEDYEQHFGEYRESTLTSLDGTCCTFFIPKPYINPYEYYLSIFEKEDSFILNSDNPFALKKIRSKMKRRIDNVKEKVKAVDEENLVYESVEISVDKYDFDQEKLILEKPISLNFNVGIGVKVINSNFSRAFPLAPKQAEKLFEYYTNNNIRVHTSKSTLRARVIFKLQKPLKNNFGSSFEAVVKKVEFFMPTDWTNKIGEITF